jgi:hypothetical protein
MNLLELMIRVATSAANLRVVTVIGTPTLGGTLENISVTLPPTPTECLVTNINLLAGDVTHIASPSFVGATGGLDAVQKAHEQLVAQAQASVKANIEALVSLANQIGSGWEKERVPERPGTTLPARTTTGDTIAGGAIT